MNDRPDNYNALQLSWSRCRNARVERLARARAEGVAHDIRGHRLRIGNVLVLGPQHGWEPHEFQRWAKRVLAVDCVPEFVADCQALGVEALQSDFETLSLDGKWNVYCHHSLEHCYDLDAAVANILAIVDQWCYLAVPIEPDVTHDRAHFSPIANADEFVARFCPPLAVVYRQDTPGNLKVLLRKVP